MGRREQPLDPGASALHGFATDLRALRYQAGSPSYRAMAARAGYSASALSAAASGAVLPSLAVTRAYVTVCKGDLVAWETRWRSLDATLAAERSLKRVLPARSPARTGPQRVLVGAAVATAVLAGAVSTAAFAFGWPDDRPVCVPGYVWREAVPGDHVCVERGAWEQARLDNARMAERREPGGGEYGPDTCRTGWVWREATPEDHACVSEEVRTRTWVDNGKAQSRWRPRD